MSTTSSPSSGQTTLTSLNARYDFTLVSRTFSTKRPVLLVRGHHAARRRVELSRPGVRGVTSPCSSAMVTVPIVPCPHIGRQPDTSMNSTPRSPSGVVGG